MDKTICQEILNGVGKKIRNGYLAGNVSAAKVMECYNKNKKEAESFSAFGWTVFELMKFEEETHNPIIKAMLQKSILEHKDKSRYSNDQNKISLEKLEFFRASALGIGLRKVISSMKKVVKETSDIKALVTLMLLELEFANLSAKKLHREKKLIYARKDILLDRLSYLLPELEWKYGISSNTGKNASYIVYVYLPNGVQLSWHSNEYQLIYDFPEIDCEWDGQVCMTMEKILNYIHENYGIGYDVKYNQAA